MRNETNRPAGTRGVDRRGAPGNHAVEALASTLAADKRTLEEHVDALVTCELAHVEADGRIRATITGEELLALDTDEVIIVDPAGRDGRSNA